MRTIKLLGRPAIQADDGAPRPDPKGRKAWGLLAFLILSDGPVERSRLASLLFEDAEDPLAALRWNLAELRRALDLPDVARGDPITLALPPGTWIDATTVLNGTWTEATKVDDLGSDLLAGLSFGSAPAFDAWLSSQRLHLAAASRAQIKEAARARLAAGAAAEAVRFAARLVELDQLDENAWSLLLRALVASGDQDAAREQLERCRSLFASALGVEPSAQVMEAANPPTDGAGSSSLAAARAQLDAGNAAIAAGAIEAGLHCLRRAAAEAARVPDGEGLRAHALLALGSTLVHAAKGRDEEGAGALEQAIELAEHHALPRVAADGLRELGYIEMLRGNGDLGEQKLLQARRRAAEDTDACARVDAVLGALLSDLGRYDEAIAALTGALAVAEDLEQVKQEAWILSFLARAHILRADHDAALPLLERCLQIVRTLNWAVFLPWPEALHADVLFARGEHDRAAELYEHAFALGCQVADPCWEGMAARGLGLVTAARGDVDAAIETLDDAARRCMRLPDAYLWIQVYTLDALAELVSRERPSSAGRWVAELREVASRTGMREFVARSHLYQAALGDGAALDTARHLAHGIDNPALHALVRS